MISSRLNPGKHLILRSTLRSEFKHLQRSWAVMYLLVSATAFPLLEDPWVILSPEICTPKSQWILSLTLHMTAFPKRSSSRPSRLFVFVIPPIKFVLTLTGDIILARKHLQALLFRPTPISKLPHLYVNSASPEQMQNSTPKGHRLVTRPHAAVCLASPFVIMIYSCGTGPGRPGF